MKKIAVFGLLAFVLVFGFSACDNGAGGDTGNGDDDDKLTPAEQIAGTWFCDDFEQERWFKFNADGTGIFDNEGTFELEKSITFNYTYDGTTLVLSDSSAPEPLPNGEYPAKMA